MPALLYEARTVLVGAILNADFCPRYASCFSESPNNTAGKSVSKLVAPHRTSSDTSDTVFHGSL